MFKFINVTVYLEQAKQNGVELSAADKQKVKQIKEVNTLIKQHIYIYTY